MKHEYIVYDMEESSVDSVNPLVKITDIFSNFHEAYKEFLRKGGYNTEEMLGVDGPFLEGDFVVGNVISEDQIEEACYRCLDYYEQEWF